MKKEKKLTARAALSLLLAKFEKHEYRQFIAQDETEGTGTYYWKMKENEDTGETPYIPDEEFRKYADASRPRGSHKRKG